MKGYRPEARAQDKAASSETVADSEFLFSGRREEQDEIEQTLKQNLMKGYCPEARALDKAAGSETVADSEFLFSGRREKEDEIKQT